MTDASALAKPSPAVDKASPTPHIHSHMRSRPWRIAERFWPDALILVVAIVMVVVAVVHVQPLSPYDEGMHFDYLVRARHLQLVHTGETVTTQAVRVQACRGVMFPGALQPCKKGAHYSPLGFGGGPINSASVHPPTYYYSEALLSYPLTTVGVSLLDAGRLIGALWLAAGMIFTRRLLRRVNAGTFATLTAVFACMWWPDLVRASSAVTDDAASITTGAAVLYVCVRSMRPNAALWPLALVGFVAMWVKDTNVSGLVVGATTMTAWAAFRRGIGIRNASARIVALVGGGVLGAASWIMVRSAIAEPGVSSSLSGGPSSFHLILDPHHLQVAALQFPQMFVNAQAGIAGALPYIYHARLTTWLSLCAVAIMSFSVVLIASRRSPAPHRALGVGGAVAFVGGSLILYLAVSVTFHGPWMSLAPRYSLCLVPIYVAVLACGLDHFKRKWRRIGNLLCSVSIAAALSVCVFITYVNFTFPQ